MVNEAAIDFFPPGKHASSRVFTYKNAIQKVR